MATTCDTITHTNQSQYVRYITSMKHHYSVLGYNVVEVSIRTHPLQGTDLSIFRRQIQQNIHRNINSQVYTGIDLDQDGKFYTDVCILTTKPITIHMNMRNLFQVTNILRRNPFNACLNVSNTISNNYSFL